MQLWNVFNVFEDAVFGGFVGAEAEEDWGPEFWGGVAGVCPLGEFDFGYEFGLDPGRFAEGFDFSGERVLLGLAGLQFLPDGSERGFGETASGLANVDQLAFRVVEAQDDRAKRLAAFFGFGVAADYAVER